MSKKLISKCQNPAGPIEHSNQQKVKKLIAKRINDRIHGDAMHGGTSGVLNAITQFIFNKKGSPEKRINQVQEYYNNHKDYVDNTRHFDAFKELNHKEFRKFDNARRLEMLKQHRDALNIYLGFPQTYNTMEKSEYKPTISSNIDSNYYQIKPLLTNDEFENLIYPLYNDYMFGVENKNLDMNHKGKTAQLLDIPYLSGASLSQGFDEKGHYISLYDTWDYNTKMARKHGDNVARWIGGTPFEIYQRYYLDDFFNIPEDKKRSYFLPEVVITPDKK